MKSLKTNLIMALKQPTLRAKFIASLVGKIISMRVQPFSGGGGGGGGGG